MADHAYQGEMDPELAALLGTGPATAVPPGFNDIFGEAPSDSKAESDVDITVEGFPKITKFYEDTPHDFFNDPNYYKTALSNEGDIAQRVHSILHKYLTAKDPKDRSVFRQQLLSPYWEFLLNVGRKSTARLAPSKKFLLRYGILHPTFINTETRELFSKIILENDYNQPIYYMDEWLKAVGTSQVRASTTDEVKISSKNVQSKLGQLLEKAQGKLDGTRALIKGKDKERQEIERILRDRLNAIFDHSPLREYSDVSDCLNERQKSAIAEIQNLLKELLRNDHDLERCISDFISAEADVHHIQDKIQAEGGAVEIDMGALDTEFETIRQMAKMTCGRQGNHFPILTSEYFHCGPLDIATRENVIAMMAKIESIDAEAYCRVYRNKLIRIVPYVVLIPTYGDSGFCWEPFDRFNRATSRGRIVIPMYPKNLYIAILSAIADFRWQVAKEKASFYWMEEGLTGNYYNWFQSQKLRGDIKEYFINDYILWMTKEAEGIQKLPKDVRGTFWRHMPFTKEVKDKLKLRSLVYQELYQRDLNRAMSDGY
jgi:hypothetical protein